MIKFTCIDVFHAELARDSLRDLGFKAAMVDRTVISSCDYDNEVVKIMCEACGYTETPNGWDTKAIKGGL